jgi:hypothetical protein
MAHHDVMAAGYAHLLTLDKEVGRARGERLTTPAITQEFKKLHEWYLDELRPALRESDLTEGLLSELDGDFDKVMSCSGGRTRTKAGKNLLGKVRKSLKGAAPFAAPASVTVASVRELDLIAALKDILPAAAAGYEQALRDLASPERVSYRGVASEFREVLREVLDHFAPDNRLPKSPDGRKPTMKAKVRYILRARSMGDTRRGAAESTAEILDDGVPNLARSVYDLGSLDTHVSPNRDEVARLRRYLEALLLDLLEIPH